MDEMNVKAVETTENKEIRPKIIAVDFDGCLVTNKFPEDRKSTRLNSSH